jgi:carbamoyl-phosphate synthase large subunit
MPLRAELRALNRPPRILLLGSGGLSIGQAGEFDYSGTQAVKALVEENCHVIVINPNIATVQTNPRPNTTVYLYPVEVAWVEKVIAKEKPDAIVAGFGGQTALNCLVELDRLGILAKYNVLNLGTPAEVLRLTEDRELFANKMASIQMPIPASIACTTVEEAVKAANQIGYPVIVRAAFALGGLGSGFADNEAQLFALAEPALRNSPQVLVEKSLKGWKEVEYEVMRDGEGNVITICNMENFDPLGIHTGDSIVVCPSQSLSDDEYQLLRNAAIKIVSELGIIGECNVQYALHPGSLEFNVIEVNARLSRSSALASKASGYPIAYIAAKVVLGFDLLELKNPVTGVTYAYFEPALDYVTVKVPRWDLTKFLGANRELGSTMKSVGEIMSIGRSFPEALQKAFRMITEHPEGLTAARFSPTERSVETALSVPTDTRIFAVMYALRSGMGVDDIHELTKIDKWFLFQTRYIIELEREIAETVRNKAKLLAPDAPETQLAEILFANIESKSWRRWKSYGFGDEQICAIGMRAARPGRKFNDSQIQAASLVLRRLRQIAGVHPVVKKIDTTAGEYPSPSNYMYMSYNGLFHDPIEPDGKVFSAVILGAGSYRIGTSVEFDWCAVSCSQRLQAAGWRSVIVNCNPETVSTDYNSSDHLYFDELTIERILDIAEFEKAVGVIASMGGQLPNKLTLPLARAGIRLLGHRPDTVDRAENREKFSALLDQLKIDQPRWTSATSVQELKAFVELVGFPVLIRPSYVLSGAAMNVAYDMESLERCVLLAADVSAEHPIVISEYIEGAREIELDGVARDGEVLTAIVSEHIENAGVHSGDATSVVPAQNLYVETVRRVRKAGRAIARGLELNGPFNIQFIAKEGEVKVIECNARAARSFPFVSKTVGLNLADAAADVMIGRVPALARFNEDELPHVGIKAAMFSFKRLRGVDPILGVEMASTGEVGCIAETFEEALLLALEATGVKPPRKGVLVSSGPERQKLKFLNSARKLVELGLPLYATPGTADYLKQHGVPATSVEWPGASNQDCISLIREHKVDLVINVPKNNSRQEIEQGREIRVSASRLGCAVFTNIEKADAYINALHKCRDFERTHQPMPMAGFRI